MTINCAGRLISLENPLVMGIVNLTPDSFYAQSRNPGARAALRTAGSMLENGATILDLGGYSTRPGATRISADEELARLIPAISAIVREFPDAVISADTFRANVAKAAVGAGASIINDVSAGLLDRDMLSTVAALKVPYVMMHMKGNPQTMQSQTQFGNIIREMISYFAERVFAARSLGIDDIIIDPGFGFSKTTEHNYFIMSHLADFQITGLPVLVGVSRKSMIGKITGKPPEDSLNGTTALHMAALERGAKILRAHDVKEAVECVRLFEQISRADG